MAKIHFASALQHHTGGIAQIELDAPRVRELIVALEERFPGLADHLKRMAVAVDGEIYHDATYRELHADSEVHFVPRISGG